MIITCNGCTKKFNLDSSLIPEQGRLLQCNGCNYKWFFKKKIVNQTITPIKIIKHDEKIKPFNEELSKSVKINNPKTEELLNEESNNNQFKEKNLTVKAGTGIILLSSLVHSGYENTDDKSVRITITERFNPLKKLPYLKNIKAPMKMPYVGLDYNKLKIS